MIRRWRARGRRGDVVPPPTEQTGPSREYRMSLASLPPGIRTTRRITVTVLTAWGVEPRTSVHDAAVLAVTELITNTVRHAARLSPSFELLLTIDDEYLDVAVRDGHPGLIELPPPGENGGLAVVAGLAHDFGGRLTVDPDPGGGKTIRVRLPLTPLAAPQE